MRGLAITSFDQGIFLGSASTGAVVDNNWFGIKLDGTLEPNDDGITVVADGTTIGSTSGSLRNVFAGNRTGISIWTADGTRVIGNWIGLKPDGFTAAGNHAGIHLRGNLAGNRPENTVIGGQLYPDEFASPACDGPCNTISGNTVGIEFGTAVEGQYSAAGATRISANYIGFDALGNSVRANETGVRIGHADDVTIGRGGAFERNRFGGGRYGVDATAQPGTPAQASGIARLRVLGNYFGLDSGGSSVKGAPSEAAIAVSSPASGPSTVEGNQIAVGEGAGIRVYGTGATVRSNRVGIGTAGTDVATGANSDGIQVLAPPDGATGENSVRSNVVGHMGRDGIVIQGSDGNSVAGNRIGHDGGDTSYPDGRYGILITDAGAEGSSLNQVGNADSNVIRHSGAAAIAVVGAASDRNELRGNTGEANGPQGDGPFIDLGGDGHGNPTGANGAPEAPAILSPGEHVVTGTGEPGSTIMLHWKTTTPRGDVASPMGPPVTVGPAGFWRYTPASPLSPGTLFAAIETTAGQASTELSQAWVVKEGSENPSTPPVVTIEGPDETTEKRPTFTFHSDKPVGSFTCRYDGQERFIPCATPFTFPHDLEPGQHWVQVIAYDTDGNGSAIAASKMFLVIEETGPTGPTGPTEPGPTGPTGPGPTGPSGPTGPTGPTVPDGQAPNTRFAKRPPKLVRLKPGAARAKVTVRFASTVPGSRFRCKVDRKPFRACGAKRRLRLAPGRHRIRVAAVAPDGTRDPSPAKAAFKVVPAV